MIKPKALIYVRVSTRNQAQSGHGLESQEKRCRDHATSRGYDVIATFSDTISGGIDYAQRPGMTALLAFLDGQTSERYIVLFDDPKRFARSTRFHLELREALRQRDAIIECLNFKFEDDSPEGDFIETIIAAQGQLERKQNGRQVAQKMRARMENGYWIHTTPIGYRYETQKGRGKVLVRNPPFDTIVQEAFEGFALGHFQTQAEVKRFFEGIPHFPRNKNGEIVQQRVTDILTHPIYTGHICSETYDIHWLKAQHEPLISLETFDKVQKRRKGKAKAPKRKNIGEAFALRGIAVCACCEVPLRSSITKGNGGHYPYYLCQTKGCEAYGKSIKRDQLEGDVSELIKALQPTEGLLTAATAIFRHIWDTRRTQAAEIVRSGKHKIAAIEKEIDKLLNLIMASDNTTVIVRYEDKISQYERKKALLAEKLSNQTEPDGTWEEKLEPALTFLANPWKLWETGNITLRRAVLKLAFKDRIYYCRNEGARTPEIALPFKALGAFSDQEVYYGAVEKTRTSTGVTPQRPQRCASTNSATTARRVNGQVIAERLGDEKRFLPRAQGLASLLNCAQNGCLQQRLGARDVVEWITSQGLTDYPAAVAEMEARANGIAAGTASEAIWLVEHPPLYTAGTSAIAADLTDPHRFPVYDTRRGGQYTYHGPGQRVAYVMLDVGARGRDVRAFVRALEDWVIATLAEFGVTGERRAGRVGVWVARPEKKPLPDGTPREDKIAAIGIRLRRWVSFHGLSINVEPDLSHFDGIVPCGITGHGVTSLVDLGLPVTMADVDVALKSTFAAGFP